MWTRRGPGLAADRVRELVSASLAAWPALTGAERVRVLDLTARLLGRWRWSGTRGFEVTDEMRVLVASHGALLGLGLGDPVLDDVREVVLQPGAARLHGPRATAVRGVVSEGATVLGHTTARGPVFIGWAAARRDAANPARGRNVVLHELAHRLDAEDGWFDGMPRVATPALRRRWVAACEAAFADVRAGRGGLLRGYAGTNPAEFFAVATEVLFTRGADLREERPALHAVLVDFYGQDPAARQGAT